MHENDRLDGKVCMVTGATGGIGKVTAETLARRGAHVVVVGRNPAKCEAVVSGIRESGGQADALIADLSSQAQIRILAEAFGQKYPRLDVLVNNAGNFFMRRQLSEDGIEMTFALNHLSYFLLTNLLLDLLKASAPARIVNVASGAHRGNALNFNRLLGEGLYMGWVAYGRSKFANILFTYELARRLEGTGITANALHPGLVNTQIGSQNNGYLGKLFQSLVFGRGISPEEGARTSVFLASSPEVENVSGAYFYREKAVSSDPHTHNLADAARLWRISAQMTGLA